MSLVWDLKQGKNQRSGHSNKCINFHSPVSCSFLSGDPYSFLKVEKIGKHNNVALIYLNRPDALNALNNGIIGELTLALDDAQNDKDIGAIVITGSGRAFAGTVVYCKMR